MALDEYKRKRRFNKTPEPGPAPARKTSRDSDPIFVVQLHHASHRHYDFRLEMDGVLKSWAVPKGPSFDPSVKRMAVEVEDHPLDYAEFEGNIPLDQYGGGHVAIFDTGTWSPVEGDALALWQKGHLKFRLDGERLKGEWHLVRTRRNGAKNQWLLFKSEDEWARKADADDLLEGVTPPTAEDVRRARRPGKRPIPDKAAPAAPSLPPQPMLARLVQQPPTGPQWIHEIKWDGYRILAVLADGIATLWSRNGIDWTKRMPAVAAGVEALGVKDAVLDGEVIVGQGTREDFNALQNALKTGKEEALVYMAFDLLEYGGASLRNVPLLERKAKLKALLDAAPDYVGYSSEAKSPAPRALNVALDAGYEGIISKRKDAPYVAGRSEDWLKTKAVATDEFAVVGYTPPKGSRQGIGSLLLATPEGADGWRYVGRVGSGINDDVLAALAETLSGHGGKTPTVRVPEHDTDLSKARWIDPEGVVEVFVRGFGGNGLLRQASFKTLRPDKRARDLRESDSGITLTSPEKLLFPESNISKQQVWDYYNTVLPWLLPEISGRPLSLVRCPGGITKTCFFQKHATPDMTAAGVETPADIAGKLADGLVVDSAADLRVLVQYNTLEFHPWGAQASAMDEADTLIFDLDPDIDLPWKDVVAAAIELRDKLQNVGLNSFVRTSGGKGLHVLVPLNPPVPWSRAKPFAEAFAKTLAQHKPERYTAAAAKAGRKGKIFVDWLRNGKGATSVASFSLRARPGAPVALPVTWAELTKIKGGDHFNLANVPPRLARLRAHPWGDYRALKQSLPQG